MLGPNFCSRLQINASPSATKCERLTPNRDERRDHVHELEVLPFHIVGERAPGVGRESKKQSKIVTRSYDGPAKLQSNDCRMGSVCLGVIAD
jgi:hypothetical protein